LGFRHGTAKAVTIVSILANINARAVIFSHAKYPIYRLGEDVIKRLAAPK